MTREEAIQHFKEQLDIFGGEHAEAIKVAIEVLKSCSKDSNLISREAAKDIAFRSPFFSDALMEELEALPSADRPRDGDLISRADAIEALGEEPPVWCDDDAEIAERNQWRADIEAIKSVPSADRPRGEWIVHDIVCREEICLPYECPNCGFRYSRRFNFCPNCGADMRGDNK